MGGSEKSQCDIDTRNKLENTPKTYNAIQLHRRQNFRLPRNVEWRAENIFNVALNKFTFIDHYYAFCLQPYVMFRALFPQLLIVSNLNCAFHPFAYSELHLYSKCLYVWVSIRGKCTNDNDDGLKIETVHMPFTACQKMVFSRFNRLHFIRRIGISK